MTIFLLYFFKKAEFHPLLFSHFIHHDGTDVFIFEVRKENALMLAYVKEAVNTAVILDRVHGIHAFLMTNIYLVF